MGIHDGHRARMREKLKKGNLLDHEVLEVFLFNAVPRMNTNELAHKLISTFGSLGDVFCASMEQLCQVEGVGESLAAYIYTAGRCYEKFYQLRMTPDVRIHEYNTDSFVEYVREAYANVDREVFDLYAINDNSEIIMCKRFSQDSLFHVRVSPEEIGNFIMKNHAIGLVMVHNHPLGDPKPSDSDNDVTMKCQLMCSLHNTLLCDHVIYAPNGVFSYYQHGLLKKISEQYSVQNVLSRKLHWEEE